MCDARSPDGRSLLVRLSDNSFDLLNSVRRSFGVVFTLKWYLCDINIDITGM